MVWCGAYCKSDKAWFLNELKNFDPIIKGVVTNDHNLIAEVKPAAIFGTQIERHVRKCLNMPCGVISAPRHIQNFPLSYRPFLIYEGFNQTVDSIYNFFTLGMEDHLSEIFGGHDTREVLTTYLSTEYNLE